MAGQSEKTNDGGKERRMMEGRIDAYTSSYFSHKTFQIGLSKSPLLARDNGTTHTKI